MYAERWKKMKEALICLQSALKALVTEEQTMPGCVTVAASKASDSGFICARWPVA